MLLVLPVLYIGLALAVQVGLIEAEGSWGWFIVFLAGLPASLVGMLAAYVVGPFFGFALLGGAQWYLISKALFDTIEEVRKPRSRAYDE
jgi:hypothetical protein